MLPARLVLTAGSHQGAAFTKGTGREIHFRLYRNGRRAARWQPDPCTSHPMRERRLSRRLCRPGWRGGGRPAWRHGNNQSSPPRDARHWTTRQHRHKGDRTRLRVRERSKGLPLTVLNEPLRRSVPDRSKAAQPCYRMAASGAPRLRVIKGGSHDMTFPRRSGHRVTRILPLPVRG
jgi:hypothetical protein